MILLLRMATLTGSSSPEAVSMTLDPSEMRMAGDGARPDTVRCHVTGTGVASTSESSVWLLDPGEEMTDFIKCNTLLTATHR